MLNFWLTICNKKGTARDLCTIPLSSIIYYTTMKKISTTTYYHPILWHRIRCTSRHTHTLYMPACPLPILGLFLHRDELFLPALVYSCNFHHKYLHDLLHSNHQFPFIANIMPVILWLIICSLYHLCLIMSLFLVLNGIGHILYPFMGTLRFAL